MENAYEQHRLTLKKYVESMPTFSPATSKILQLANQMNASPNELVAAIRMDPVLTGKVLQLVNSAYFSLAQKITSLNRALVYLGLNTIKNLALSTAVMEAFDTKNEELKKLIAPTWRHSLATAVCSKSIARASRVPPNALEEYFIAGLLHKIGQIVMIQAFYSTAPHNGRISLSEERETYGLDHGEVGADTLRRWEFSDELICAVGGYHSPSDDCQLSHYLHIADAMTYRLGLNGDAFEAEPARAISPVSFSAIGLSENEVEKELGDAAEQIERAEIFLNIASNREKVGEEE
jgi:HD-like signal output (HDOD) protein